MADDRVMVTVVPGDLFLRPLVVQASPRAVTLVWHEASVLHLTPLRLLVMAVSTSRISEGERQEAVFNVPLLVTLKVEGDLTSKTTILNDDTLMDYYIPVQSYYTNTNIINVQQKNLY